MGYTNVSIKIVLSKRIIWNSIQVWCCRILNSLPPQIYSYIEAISCRERKKFIHTHTHNPIAEQNPYTSDKQEIYFKVNSTPCCSDPQIRKELKVPIFSRSEGFEPCISQQLLTRTWEMIPNTSTLKPDSACISRNPQGYSKLRKQFSKGSHTQKATRA